MKQVVVNHIRKKVRTSKLDSDFDLYLYYPLKEFEPETEFQRDMINEVKKIKIWDSVMIENTNISVSYRRYLQFQKNKDTIYRNYTH